MKDIKKYNYFYKITNLINNHFYYGIHSTNDIYDGYMGSGRRLKLAYKKYGIENFKKEILKYFDTRNEAAKYESEIVTESLIKNDDCYNLILGGEEKTTLGTASFKDKNNNRYHLPIDDERVKNGDFIGINKGLFTAKDNNGQHYQITNEDERFLKGELKGLLTGLVLAKDKNGNCFMVSKNDKRFYTKELSLFWVGKKHSENTKRKMKEIYQKTQHQKGNKNSQYGTCWITKNSENKKIKKEELSNYENLGWIKGRKIKK